MLIPQRFCGPPRSGNGGYTAGLLATKLNIGAEPLTVTLRRPPPLDTELRLEGHRLYHGDQLIADTRAGELEAAPPPVTVAQAKAATTDYRGLTDHPFPTCFVCGPAREPGDGLRIFPGPVSGIAETVATTWETSADIAIPFVWAALDCPGAWALEFAAGRPVVLGRMTAAVATLPAPRETCVVIGQQRWVDGRKSGTATALYNGNGQLLAHSEAIWFTVDPAQFGALT